MSVSSAKTHSFGDPQNGPELFKISPNIYTARGYDIVNSSMIIGTDGIIIIDSGSQPSSARTVCNLFRSVTDLPIKALVLTHGHGDHTGGAAFYLKENPHMEIWAAHNFNSENMEFITEGVAPLMAMRGARQIGQTANSPSGNTFDARNAALTPTHFVENARTNVEICGIPMDFLLTPGETRDHMSVWLPNEMVLFCGDNFYASFPNAYPVRGGRYRDLAVWADSLDRLTQLPANSLVPGHGDVIEGVATVHTTLSTYRDALSHILEKTIEGMNKGLDPDDLVEYVTLPEEWAKLPFLQEGYGNIAWTVRAIYHAKAGWFNGNPSTLNPLHPREEARRMLEMIDRDALLQHMRNACANADYQWTLQLADRLLALNPQDSEARSLKAEALDHLAEAMQTQTGSRYYASVAAELRAGK